MKKVLTKLGDRLGKAYLPILLAVFSLLLFMIMFGSVHQTIHIWHDNPKRRGTVSKMLLAIKTTCRRLDRTENFAWNVRNVNQRLLPDTTTKQPLLHGLLEIEFSFS